MAASYPEGEATGACGGDMTKSDLIRHVAEQKKLSRGRAESLINQVFDCIVEALQRNERVEIRGIGSFETRRYGAYTGRNPRTGVNVTVKPKRLPFFKAGKGLKDIVNDRLRRTQDLPAVEAAATSAPTNAKSA
jgi:integration host factor subunit beta